MNSKPGDYMIMMLVCFFFQQHGRLDRKTTTTTYVYVMVHFYPWFKLYFLLFWGMVMYDNEFETKENRI